MTIEELRARKRELLARKRHELELQARGEGDNLALFMVREELGDVNDQLRALTAGRRRLRTTPRTASSIWTGGGRIPPWTARSARAGPGWRRQPSMAWTC